MDKPMNIYHITSHTSWSAAQAAGTYAADSLATQGFIHLSKADQVLRVANFLYKGQSGLVLLVVDPGRLTAELRWEPGTDKPDELFPHIYGLLNLDAVLRVVDFPPAPDGTFNLPLL